MRVRRLVAAVVCSLTLVVGAGLSATPVAAAPKQPPLRILVTNDDGFAAPGISALVEALRKLPNTKVTVVAPAQNQSGSRDKTSEGKLFATKGVTVDGYPATSVAGYPADSVNYALENVLTGKKAPNLVVAGVNSTQNLGAFIETSGTIGAARTAARAGIPALAVSQGDGDSPDYPLAVREAVNWVKQFRKSLATNPKPAASVESINVPTCAVGEVRGLVEVPSQPGPEDAALNDTDCSSTLENPTTDVQAFNAGFATLSELSF